MAKSLGSPLWLLIVWLTMGAMAACGALCYGELAARYPEAGGSYVYLREAYGRPLAFLYGWMCLLVMDPGLTAALAVGAASYAAYIFGLPQSAIKILAIVTVFVLAALNIRGVRLGGLTMRVLTIVKLVFLIFLPIWAFALQLGSWSNFVPLIERRAVSASLLEALAGGVVLAFFSFGGWWDVTKLAGETREPARTLPGAMIYGVLIVTLVYILTSAVFLYLVALDAVSSGETFATQAGEALFGSVGGQFFSAIVLIAVLSSMAAIMMSAPRVYFAMARDRLFFATAASIHPRFGTPTRAIALQAVLASLLVTLGSFNQIISYFIFVVIVFIVLTVAALFVLRRNRLSRITYMTPGYPVTPIVFLFLAILLLILIATNNLKQSLVGAGVVALGIPIYYLVFQRGLGSPNRKESESI